MLAWPLSRDPRWCRLSLLVQAGPGASGFHVPPPQCPETRWQNNRSLVSMGSRTVSRKSVAPDARFARPIRTKAGLGAIRSTAFGHLKGFRPVLARSCHCRYTEQQLRPIMPLVHDSLAILFRSRHWLWLWGRKEICEMISFWGSSQLPKLVKMEQFDCLSCCTPVEGVEKAFER